MIKEYGEDVKIVEKGGRTLKQLLQKSAPGQPSVCHHQDCPVCATHEGPGSSKCGQESVGYSATCIICEEEGVVTKYVGEMARNAYTRTKEHQQLLNRRSAHSCLWAHHHQKHLGQLPRFKFKVDRSFKDDCLGRQVNEGIRIWRGEGLGILLNDRSEWNHPGLVRATLERQ